MIKSLAFILSGIFLILSLLHLYWGLGGTQAKASTLPTTRSGENLLKPTPLHCFIIAAGLILFGLLPLLKIGLLGIEIPSRITVYSLRVVVAIFFLRAMGDFRYVGFFKKVRDTQFSRMDTLIYSPLSFMIAVMALLLLSLD